jgi:hypothetical protein
VDPALLTAPAAAELVPPTWPATPDVAPLTAEPAVLPAPEIVPPT